ncbi:PilC/PilY family type IV pilus protein [Granulosicoccaceae sp. 1_MG-2023]|nr:PilC/PilY family type IV pilus protein [Granulosicoccaceae sp. 1_MG-2023]
MQKYPLLTTVRAIVSGTAIALLSVGNALYADDTEVFFGAQTAQSTSFPNVLFVLDTSGSMSGTDGTGSSRIDRMKDALTQILDSATNINVGIMRLNGYYGGGSVLYPVTYIDKELCPNGICDGGSSLVDLSARVNASSDDVTESSASLTMYLDDPELVMFKDETGYEEKTEAFPITDNEDQAEQMRDSDTFMLGSWDLDFFYDVNWKQDEIVFGLRFPDVDIPGNAQILSASISMQADTSKYKGAVNALVAIEDAADSPIFDSNSGKRIHDRTWSSDTIEWNDVSIPPSDGILETPDLSSLLSSRIERPDWSPGSGIAFKFQHNDDSAYPVDSDHYRRIHAWPGYTDYAPRLNVTYSSSTITPQKLGLRFDNLRIPQGATITSASLEFTSTESNSADTTATIRAQASDDAPTFTSSNGNLSSRSLTSASVDWDVDVWEYADETYQSVDISPVLQEVVDRDGWCGGNAIALILEGSGLREAVSYDQDPNSAPVLKLEYDASTIPSGGGCTAALATATIAVDSDDVEQDANGDMTFSSNDIELGHDGSLENSSGLRFRDITVPQGATITGATLEMTARQEHDNNISVTISAHNTADAGAFSAVDYYLDSLDRTSASVDWYNLAAVEEGDGLVSPDISSVIQELVNKSDWENGNSISLLIDYKSGTGTRKMYAYADSPTKVARLNISYRTAANNAALSGTDPIVYKSTREKMIEILDDMQITGGTPTVGALYEAARYYKGLSVDFGTSRGTGKYRHQYHRVSHASSYTGGSVYTPDKCSTSNYNNWYCKYEEISGNAVYTSPINDTCQSSHIVLLSDGSPTSSATDEAKDMIGSNYCDYRGSGTCGEELAAYLKDNDQSESVPGTQGIKTYTIGFNFTSDWMKDVAAAGGGTFYTADSSQELVDAFSNILAEILKVDTSFVAPSATVNEFNRLTHRNDVYFSLFKPDEKPTWAGNLKQYRLQGDPSVLVDANGDPAVDDSTGFFMDNAQSYWSDTADGNSVALGGAANEISLNRNLYTYTGTDTDLTDGSNEFHEDNSSLTKAMFDLSGQSDAYFDEVVRWARGVDINDEDNDGNYSESRRHMGDPMHSQPVIINYDTDDSVIFVATNEGFLHAIDSDDGKEIYAFVPQELLPNFDTFYKNRSSYDHPYGLDGPITTWYDESTGERLLFVTMRRGGNKIYALDISSKEEPKLKWIIDGDTSDDYSNLGQTWSQVEATKIRINGETKEVVIFGGGYDTNQDDALSTTEDSVGNAIYIADMRTGERLWWASNDNNATERLTDMKYSIPSDIATLDVDLDGILDQFYVGDMGGQIWRFDLDQTATSYSDLATGGVMADFSGTEQADARRFYYPPDVALISADNSYQLAISIGSGYRAHPLNLIIEDRFYSLRTPYVFTAPPEYGFEDADGNFEPATEDNLADVTDDLEPDMTGKNGWMLRMEESGEKVISTSVTLNNNVIFTAYRPEQASTACATALGGGVVYAVSVLDGSPALEAEDGEEADTELRVVELSQGGIPPEATVLFPSDVDNSNDITPIILVGAEQPEELKELTGDLGLTRRTFWQNNPEGQD